MPFLILSNNNVSTLICVKCYSNLKNSYDFINNCYVNNEILLKYTYQFNCNCKTVDEPCEFSANLEKLNTNKLENEIILEYEKQTNTPVPSTSEKQYVCRVCDKSFSQGPNLKRHYESIHLKIRYFCDICNKSFSDVNALRNHTRAIHFNIKNHECHICKRKLSTAKTLRLHLLKIHKEPKINKKARKKFIDEETTETNDNYIEAETPETNDTYIEEETFPVESPSTENRHEGPKINKNTKAEKNILTDNETLEKFNEIYIKAETPDFSNEESPSRENRPEGPHISEICEKTFSPTHSVIPFQNVHLKQRDESNDTYIEEETVPIEWPPTENRHEGPIINQNTKAEKNNLTDDETPETFNEINIKTETHDICNEESPSTENRLDGPHTCDICGKTFSSKHSVIRHYQNVHLKLRDKCNLCNKLFSGVSSLKFHQETVHFNIKKYECPVCKRKFSKMSSLKNHMQSQHKDGRTKRLTHNQPETSYLTEKTDTTEAPSTRNLLEGPYKCNLCAKTFSTRRNVKRHHENFHLKIRYKCDICDKLLTGRTSVQFHKQTVHLKIKKHECSICNKKFMKSIYLRQHLRKHEMKECPVCKRVFNTVEMFREHYKTHDIRSKESIALLKQTSYKIKKIEDNLIEPIEEI